MDPFLRASVSFGPAGTVPAEVSIRAVPYTIHEESLIYHKIPIKKPKVANGKIITKPLTD